MLSIRSAVACSLQTAQNSGSERPTERDGLREVLVALLKTAAARSSVSRYLRGTRAPTRGYVCVGRGTCASVGGAQLLAGRRNC
eukprot:6184367-Pleurochrysis_carterae.AAC.6